MKDYEKIYDAVYAEVAEEFDALAAQDPNVVSRGANFDLTLENRLESAGYYDSDEED